MASAPTMTRDQRRDRWRDLPASVDRDFTAGWRMIAKFLGIFTLGMALPAVMFWHLEFILWVLGLDGVVLLLVYSLYFIYMPWAFRVGNRFYLKRMAGRKRTSPPSRR